MDRRALFHETRRIQSPKSILSVPYYFLRWTVSFGLDFLVGYGVYYLWRLFIAYLVVVLGFALGYYVVARRPLQWPTNAHELLDVITLSVTTFLGRGLQPMGLPIAGARMDSMAILEAIIGLLMEGLFIAAFTRRIIGN